MRSKSTSVKIPIALKKTITQRIVEAGYSSFTAYVLGLIRYDLMTRYYHKVTSEIAQMPLDIQDRIDNQLAKSYEEGETFRSAWWDDALKKAAEDTKVSEDQLIRSLLRNLSRDNDEQKSK